MGWSKRWRERLRVVFRRDEVERELEEELALHLELETEKNVRAGMTPAEARRRATLTFGHAERHKEEVRDARWAKPLLHLSPDMKLAIRMLLKHPWLSVVGGFGMAVAIAVAAGFYTFMAGVYYSAPPLDEADRIVALDNADVLNNDDSRSSLFEYHTWRTRLRTVTDVAAFMESRVDLEIRGVTARSENVAQMTASGFRLARVAPVLGRPLVDEDEGEGAPAVLVVGEREWREEFAGDPQVIGREVRLDGVIHTVVGVMPEDFRFPSNFGYWTALRTARTTLSGPGEGPNNIVFARIAPGLGLSAVQAEAAALHQQLAAEHPQAFENRRPVVVPYARAIFDLQQYPPLLIFAMQLFAVLVLTLIAVNVAVLVYARTAARSSELTIRTALGATRRRIVTQLFVEALALSGLAAGLGLAIAQLGYSTLLAIPDLRENVPYWITGKLPLSTILYACVLAVLAAFVIGAVPGLQATGRRLQASLRQIGGATGMRMGTTWTVLIVIQVAIAVTILPSVVAVAWNSVWAPPPKLGFAGPEALLVRLTRNPLASNESQSVVERQQREAAFPAVQAELIRRLEAEAGVTGVTYSAAEPKRLMVASAPNAELTGVGVAEVDTRFFEVLGFQLLAGRRFEPADRTDNPTSAVVSRTFANYVLGGGNPVGRQVWTEAGEGQTRSYVVVGVVEDRVVLSGPRDPQQAVMYLPKGLDGGEMTFYARIQGKEPLAFLPRAREIARSIAPDYGFSGSDLGRGLQAEPEEVVFVSLVVSLITVSILLLSAAGVAAMMSFAVTRRQREIGIRTALGARRAQILWSIFSHSARQIALGLVVGTVGAVVLDRFAGGEMLRGEEMVLAPLVAVLMVVAALLATLGPARRAFRVQPMEALRLE